MRQVAILGAGAIGGYLGNAWGAALARAQIGLTLVGRGASLAAMARLNPQAQVTDDPGTLSAADLILVTTKSTALPGVIEALSTHARGGTPVLSLLNGLSPARDLAASLPGLPVLGGMVPFNVTWSDTGFHRTSAGALTVQDHAMTRRLAEAVRTTKAPLRLVADPLPIQRGKLLLNLINPINALCGGPLVGVLASRDGRRVFAAAVAEGLAAYDALGLPWQQVGPFSPRLSARLLRLPDWVFNTTILRIQGIDRQTRTSMTMDLAAGKPTEIDALNAEIVRLAEQARVAAPVNSTLVRLIESAKQDSARIKPRTLAQLVGL